MKTLSLLFLALVIGATCRAQGSYAPYGLDMELIYNCGPTSCPQLDLAIQANATWVRIFVPWGIIEPSQPTGTPQPSTWGQMSGQHSYDWSYPDGMIGYAVSHGLNVYAQLYWVAPWANGNPYGLGCDPVAAYTGNQCYVYWNGGQYVNCNGNQGQSGCTAVGNPQGVPPMQTLNVGGTQVAASTAFEDFAYNLAARYPQVQYFGPMNEPNFTNMYNPPGGYTGNYLNYYMQYLATPVLTGIQGANSNNQLVGPDASLTGGATSGLNSFVIPLYQYFSSSFGVWSVHSYHNSNSSNDHQSVRNDMDTVFSNIGNLKPIWLTESGFLYYGNTTQSDNVSGLYVDEYNRSYYWTKTFYHDIQDGSGSLAGGYYGLIDQYGNYRPAFYTYQTLYGR